MTMTITYYLPLSHHSPSVHIYRVGFESTLRVRMHYAREEWYGNTHFGNRWKRNEEEEGCG